MVELETNCSISTPKGNYPLINLPCHEIDSKNLWSQDAVLKLCINCALDIFLALKTITVSFAVGI